MNFYTYTCIIIIILQVNTPFSTNFLFKSDRVISLPKQINSIPKSRTWFENKWLKILQITSFKKICMIPNEFCFILNSINLILNPTFAHCEMFYSNVPVCVLKWDCKHFLVKKFLLQTPQVYGFSLRCTLLVCAFMFPRVRKARLQ